MDNAKNNTGAHNGLCANKSNTTIQMAAVKATLYHFDGNTSEITMLVPNYTNWGEFLETGINTVREYVFNLTRYWIKISHFVMVVGTVKPDGSINSVYEPIRHDIPLGLFYSPSKRGEWVSAEQHPHHPRYNQRGSSMDIAKLMKTVNERGEAVYKKDGDDTTLCGVPFESRCFYFIDGDIPAGEFVQDSKTYLVVYSFVKSAKGGAACK